MSLIKSRHESDLSMIHIPCTVFYTVEQIMGNIINLLKDRHVACSITQKKKIA